VGHKRSSWFVRPPARAPHWRRGLLGGRLKSTGPADATASGGRAVAAKYTNSGTLRSDAWRVAEAARGTPEAAPLRDMEDPVMAGSGERSEICQGIAGIVNARGVPGMPQQE
jgi:hypothetical protein